MTEYSDDGYLADDKYPAAIVDFKQIFFYSGMREGGIGFGIWIRPQLEKRPKPAVSIPWSGVLSSFIYSSITSLVRNQ